VNEVLLELYRHKTWATLRLIEHCQRLGDDDLDAILPGTYGTIRETLNHLVRSEEGYFARLTGERLSEPLGKEPVSLGELADRIGRLGSRWEELAEDAELPDRELITNDRWRVPGRVVMAQAIHHAGDHRTHVLSILGARGLEVPELDVWDYAVATGHMTEVKAT
jgi:uncharacterized damage-inducible protein DinB